MTTTTNNAAPSGAQSGQAQTQLVTQNNTALKQVQESTITKTLERVNAMQQSGELVLPHGYEAANALKSAWLYLQTVENRGHQKAIDVCSKDSICNCLLEMCIRGEHPKKHCYFIPCGNSLEFWERYTGKVMRAKRDTNIADVHAHTATQRNEDIAEIITKERSEFRKETIINILNMRDKAVKDLIEQGVSFMDSLVQISPRVSGVWEMLKLTA